MSLARAAEARGEKFDDAAARADGRRPAPTLAPTQSDTIRQGGKKPPPLRIGMVDLETGRCVVGVGQVGSPHPSAEKYTRPRR